MLKEINTLTKMKCFRAIPVKEMPAGAVKIGCKWVFKLKFKDGKYDKHRARLVALGYQQQHGRDFWEVFSPTCNQTSIRLILGFTAMPGWRQLDMDAECAFISGKLPPGQRVYLQIPPGFDWFFGDGMVLEVLSGLYGLKQSPMLYFMLSVEVYTKAGLTQLKADECIFVRLENNIKGAAATLSTEDILKQGFFATMPEVHTT